MLSYEQITDLLRQTGLPFAYHHFSEGESPAPPFLVYLTPGSHNFSADGMVYYRADQLDIELYTDKKQRQIRAPVHRALLFAFQSQETASSPINGLSRSAKIVPRANATSF